MSDRLSNSPDLSNQVLGGYRVLHRIGRGGMAEVYLAFHENLRRHVALKVLRQDLVGLRDHHQRFLQEARAAASLIHPNIVQVYDIGQFDQVHYIAQEYIPGSDLGSYIRKRGSLPIPESLSILLQVSAALQKAASVGIVHRDIKPENILLTPDGEVKVADFGLARARGQDVGLTEVGVAMGTPLYMSPEQIQGQEVDPRSDLYSLGVTAFHMLAGRPPFEGDTALSLALQHMQNQPPDLQMVRNDLPYSLSKVIQQLLAKKPENRFANPNQLLKELRAVAEKLPGGWHGDRILPLADLSVNRETELAAQTIRLQTAMLRQRSMSKRRWVQNTFVVIAGLGLVLGCFALPISRIRPLIPTPTSQSVKVPKKGSVAEQYFHGLIHGNSLARWYAVENYFPPDQNAIHAAYNVKAWLRIAREATGERAEEAIRKILSLPESDVRMRILALIQRANLKKSNNESHEDDLKTVRKLRLGMTAEDVKFVIKVLPQSLIPLWNQTDV